MQASVQSSVQAAVQSFVPRRQRALQAAAGRAALEPLLQVELRLDFFHLDTNVGFDDLALASSDSELDARAPKKAKKSKKKPEL